MADDVADDENQAIPEGDRIKPVATGGRVLCGDEVLGGDVGTGNDGHRRRQQRLLHDDGRVADVAVPLGQLLHAGLGGQPCPHPVGHVHKGELHALDRAVVPAPRRDDEVEEMFLCCPRALEVSLHPPLGSRLWLARLVHAVEHLEDLLAVQLGVDLSRKQADGVYRRTECAVSGVDRDESVVGPLEANQQRGDVVENAAHVVGRTHGLVPVSLGRHWPSLLRTLSRTESRKLVAKR